MSKPLDLLKLKARMALAELSVTEVARLAGVSVPRTSEVLNGRRIDVLSLNKISRVIRAAQIPAGVSL